MADLSIHELIKQGRIIPARTKDLEFEGLLHLVKVMEYATNTDCFESLRSALNRVACRDDEPVYLTSDGQYDFWWAILTKEEAEQVRQSGWTVQLNLRGRYHGGIIGHRRYKDGQETSGKDWTIHT